MILPSKSSARGDFHLGPISDQLQQLAINITLRHVHEEDIIVHVIKGISHFAQTEATTRQPTSAEEDRCATNMEVDVRHTESTQLKINTNKLISTSIACRLSLICER